eukprot:4707278-Amphidinium_carterae.1
MHGHCGSFAIPCRRHEDATSSPSGRRLALMFLSVGRKLSQQTWGTAGTPANTCGLEGLQIR